MTPQRAVAEAAESAALAAVTAIGLDRRAYHPAAVLDWTILGVVWLLALIALSSPAWLWVPGSVLVTGIHTVFLLRGLGLSPLGLTRLAASSYAVVSILAVFAALRPALRTHAAMAVRRAALASRSAAERAAVAAIGEVRRGRLALLELEALPPQPVILTVLASGDAAELFLPFDQPPAGCDLAALGLDLASLARGLPAPSAWRAALEADSTGPGCLEVRWRTAVPA